ncbi:MAG TPA: hypothetical protein VFG38_00285, partial [Pseudomonadales bacterium]|nr:hypothetical protein [Pseudomonadales bacterium]
MHSSIITTIRHRARAAILASLAVASISANAATNEELEAQLRTLADQVATLQAQLAKVTAEQNAQLTSASPRGSLTPDAATASTGAVAPSNDRGVSLFGYGEITYARPTDNPSDTTENAQRFVIGMSNQFDENTRMVSELEVEN